MNCSCVSSLRIMLMALLAACGPSEVTRPEEHSPIAAPIASRSAATVAIQVPSDTLFFAAEPIQLTAIAHDAAGEPMQATPDWSVSDATIGTISSTGALHIERTGVLTIRVRVDGAEAEVQVPVVAVDRETAGEVLNDPFLMRVVNGLGRGTGESAREHLARANAALVSGDLAALRHRAVDLRTAIAAAADGPDRALAGVLELYLVRLENALDLHRQEY